MIMITTMMMMMMIMIMMLILLLLLIEKKGAYLLLLLLDKKDANLVFFNIFTAPRTVANTYTQVARAQSCANHVQHIERLSRATCGVSLGTKEQLSH